MTSGEKNKLWIGIGCGVVAGFGTGYLVKHSASKREQRLREERLRRELEDAYNMGFNDGFNRGTEEDIVDQANKIGYDEGYETGYHNGKMDGIAEGYAKTDEFVKDYCKTHLEKQDSEEKKEEKPAEAVTEPEKKSLEKIVLKKAETAPIREQVQEQNDPTIALGFVPPIKVGLADYNPLTNEVIFNGGGGVKFPYPAKYFIGPDGQMLDSLDIRNNIRRIEHNRARLNLIWVQMGWGAYVPDLDDFPADLSPTVDDIENLDVIQDLDDDDDKIYGDEPEEKTRERERYLDEVNRYIAHPEEAPRIISRQEFDEEAYLDQLYFDYYDVDNKFVESTDVDNEIGPYDYFGVTDGKELFKAKEGIDDDDIDVVHVKNFKMNCVIEVTRYHRAYESIKDGGAYVADGGTD